MGKKLSTLVGLLVVGVTLGLIGLLIYGLVRGVEDNPALVGSVLTAGLTIGGGIWLAAYQSRLQHHEDTARIQREKITSYYEDLIKYVSAKADSSDQPPTAKELRFLGELSRKMLLWSSPALIATWTESMRITETDPPEPEAVIAYGRSLKAIRKELGHKDSQLDLRDLLRLIVNDVDEHIPAGLK